MDYHVLKYIFAQDILLAKLEKHIIGLGKYYCAKELQAPLWEINIQHRVLAVQLRKASLYFLHTPVYVSRCKRPVLQRVA